jgi:nitronate monooxygenase
MAAIVTSPVAGQREGGILEHMWPRSDLIELLGIREPILQAPMAGATTPELAAAVTDAGGLGALGAAVLSPDELRRQVGAFRVLASGPLNVNFFVHTERPATDEAVARVSERLAGYYRELGIDVHPEPVSGAPPFGEEMLEVVLEIRPEVVSFHFGLPDQEAVAAIQETGARVLSTATTVGEAIDLAERGVDAIIAQGAEAGGHRGTHDADLPLSLVGTMALVPQVVDAVDVPVIAAGGIADGRGVAAAFVLGASGVQIGTAFLASPEAATHPEHRRALALARPEDTTVTTIFSGRPARALRNRLVAESTPADEADALPFPLQLSMTAPLGEPDLPARDGFRAMWTGQGVGLTRPMPAGELVAQLVEEARPLLPRDAP